MTRRRRTAAETYERLTAAAPTDERARIALAAARTIAIDGSRTDAIVIAKYEAHCDPLDTNAHDLGSYIRANFTDPSPSPPNRSFYSCPHTSWQIPCPGCLEDGLITQEEFDRQRAADFDIQSGGVASVSLSTDHDRFVAMLQRASVLHYPDKDQKDPTIIFDVGGSLAYAYFNADGSLHSFNWDY